MTMMNTRPLTRAATISLLVGLLAIITTAQTPEAIPKTDPVARLSTELEPKVKEEIQQGRLPGFAIGVIRNGKTDLRERLWRSKARRQHDDHFKVSLPHGLSDKDVRRDSRHAVSRERQDRSGRAADSLSALLSPE